MPIERLVRRPVKALGPDDSCEEAAALMRDENVGAVVVVDEGRVQGVVTDRDITVRVVAAGRAPREVPLREVMSGEPIFLSKARTLDQLVAAMRDMGVRRIPVIEDDGSVYGLVSMDDLLVLISEQLAELAQVIRKEIQPPL